MIEFKNSWAMATCVVAGRAHVAKNLPSQDKTSSLFKNGVSVVSLADGAGSARLSHFGADIVTDKICEILASSFDELFNDNESDVKRQILSVLLETLHQKVDELKCDLKDLTSTLLAIGVKDDRFIMLHIGDGVIGYTKNGDIYVLSTPQNGEFINETTFLSSKNAIDEMRVKRELLNGIDGFLLLSDGAEHSLYHKREKRLATALLGIVNALKYVDTKEIEIGLKQSFENVVSMATSDDCSIAIMSKVGTYITLSREKKMEFLQTASHKFMTKCDKILAFLSRPRTLKQISKHIKLKQKIVKKHILRLCKLKVIRLKNGFVFF
ncbi:PP2C family serine/threonine-protein phosphatase [Campylobacter gastrosuis]|uniref:Protein phosphatase 2C domain-containing protein n=1 Tax=Campylobacter gastrosuis TaxID=2974576 RepID=A0ABT7HMC4_9BACT|nr:PP2C family serine/threonine-protein phosphatase [Campylobacter gastrosuis]MDL0087867.1 protein phosphatase 2C domain-containing protein [Campylobacter gastrosuis]MDL0088078.1 protein phosphatase 2C domain-containing protein [Campylobacter gastrosuis]